MSPREALGSIALALAPAHANDPPPLWLRPAQVEAYRRALAAVRRHGGALLAEPVGTGKTWIALAVARAEGGHAACVVPAALRDQWLAAARGAGAEVSLTTHEQWSRGPRELGPGLVIVDESHRFRSRGIRRTANLAPALVERHGLLLSATPVVNRLDDLAHQLLLFVRDDVLAPSGTPSLTRTLGRGDVPHALSEVIVSGSGTGAGRPEATTRTIPGSRWDGPALTSLISATGRLRLSPAGPVRRLLRGVFLTALASSPLAFRTALDRYRLLLLQRRDAVAAGRRPARAALRRLLAEDLGQTVLWEILETGDGADDLVLEDLPRLEALIGRARALEEADPKLGSLRALLEDGTRTVVFTTSRATVDHLRRGLRPSSRIAWCSGSGAGIGPTRLPRRYVLRWFRPSRQPLSALGPSVLIATDVAAEGLDLQRAARVIHYDLPWTPMRLEQRAGRVQRLGALHDAVEIVRFGLPAVLERRLRLAVTLARKAVLPARIGLGPEPHPAWTWRAEIARRLGDRSSTAGAAAVRCDGLRLLAGFELLAGGAGGRVISAQAVVQDGTGRWRGDPASLDQAFGAVEAGAERARVDQRTLARAREALDRWLGPLVREVAGCMWGMRPVEPSARAALHRVQRLAARAARERDRGALARAEHGLAFLRRGHTTGEQILAARLAELGDSALLEQLERLPPAVELPPPVRVRVTGMVLFVNR